MPRPWSPCFLFLPMLLIWHYTTRWSSGTPPYLRNTMSRQWSPGNLPRVLRIWESVFYSQAFFSLYSLAELHADLRNIARTHLFVWITAIYKIFFCGRFSLRARAGQSRNINLHGELILRNICFEIFASYGIWTLFAIGEYVTSLL